MCYRDIVIIIMRANEGVRVIVWGIAFVVMTLTNVSGQLSSTFYDSTCPNLTSTVSDEVNKTVSKEPRMGASLLRLHFHDCFVQGCDGSDLLDDNATFTGEKTAGANNNSLRGFDVIDTIKSKVESICTQTVSCADILALVARDSVVALGGPSWEVLFGRRDSTTANFSLANDNLPNPLGNLSELITNFQKQGLNETEMITLSGAHTIGQARCVAFRSRIYNDTNINSTFASSLQANCSSASGSTDNNLAPLDVSTPTVFDNDYYTNLLSDEGLLHSDQELFNGGSADDLVSNYSSDSSAFFDNFSQAMVKMGNINPLTGSDGEIRINCRKVNGNNGQVRTSFRNVNCVDKCDAR